MKSGIRTSMALALLIVPAGVSLAQHEGHPTGGAPTGDGPCLANAREGLRLVEKASRQLEEARQTNSPQQMRAAISALQASLTEIRSQLSLCVAPAGGGAGMGAMDHSGKKGMNPPETEGMDHSRMGEETPRATKAPAGGMDHSKMGSGKPPDASAAPAKNPVDPVCGMEVGARAHETATYQGKAYFFCSPADREKFLAEPAKYVNRRGM